MPALHFILADYGKLGRAFVERDEADMGRRNTIEDLMSGQVDRPVSVFCAEDGMWRDVSEDIAIEIAAKREPLSPALIDFIERNAGAALARELRAA